MINIRFNEVIFNFERMAKETYENLVISLKGIEEQENSEYESHIRIQSNKPMNNFDFGGSKLSGVKDKSKDWLISQALKQLVQGLSFVLMDCIFALDLSEREGEEYEDIESLKLEFGKLREENESKNFGQLFRSLCKKIDVRNKMEVWTINGARACLEHAGGIIRDQDADRSGALRVSWVKAELFLRTEGGEEELMVLPFSCKEGGSLVMKFDHVSKEFKIGEKIVFSIEEFLEILSFSIIFVKQLVVDVHARVASLNVTSLLDKYINLMAQGRSSVS